MAAKTLPSRSDLVAMEESADKIYAQHRGLIRSLVNSVVVNNPSVVDSQDLQQVGAMALLTALKSYDPSLGSFPSYVRKCIRNALLEQANSFNKVFTVDEKVRRQVNAIIKMRKEGIDDNEIMTRLGVKTKATFLSLLGLVDNKPVSLDHSDVETESSMEEEELCKTLDEVGLAAVEIRFVHLVISNHSMDEIMDKMSVSRSRLYTIKKSIHNKILAWGRDYR